MALWDPVEIPLSETNFARFGVSTTPTLVLVDPQGIVRLYNPGNASYELLAARIEAGSAARLENPLGEGLTLAF